MKTWWATLLYPSPPAPQSSSQFNPQQPDLFLPSSPSSSLWPLQPSEPRAIPALQPLLIPLAPSTLSTQSYSCPPAPQPSSQFNPQHRDLFLAVVASSSHWPLQPSAPGPLPALQPLLIPLAPSTLSTQSYSCPPAPPHPSSLFSPQNPELFLPSSPPHPSSPFNPQHSEIFQPSSPSSSL
jgi:hypothetical protein